MGVINLSPESFYSGSIVSTEKELVRRVEEMEREGADLIDIGAVSSAPYRWTWIDEELEVERLKDALNKIMGITDLPISVDTFRYKPAEMALRLGADAINDVTGLAHSPEIARLVSDQGASMILVANDVRCEGDVVKGIEQRLEAALKLAIDRGIPHDKIVVDPGIGFHRRCARKWYEVDAEIIARLRELGALGRPICVGISRKSFLGALTEISDPRDRGNVSRGAEAIAVLNGAHMIRTHDVLQTLQVVRVAEFIRRMVR